MASVAYSGTGDAVATQRASVRVVQAVAVVAAIMAEAAAGVVAETAAAVEAGPHSLKLALAIAPIAAAADPMQETER